MANRRSDDRFSGARNLLLNRSVRGLVGGRDRSDFYKFTSASRLNFSLGVSGFRSNVNVRLFNSNRQPIATSRLPGNRAERISATLDSGTFFLQVQLAGGRRNTSYNLRTSATVINPPNPPVPPVSPPVPPVPPVPPIGDGTLATATDLGVLTGTLTRADVVGPEDTVDIYKFALNDIANLQLRLNNSTSAADLELIQDTNGNGLVDTGEVIDSDRFGTNSLASITEDLPIGTYFLRVTNSSSTATQYSLNVVPTFFGGNVSPEPGNTLPVARDLGALSGTFTAKEYVGKVDAIDLYGFTLNDASNVQFSVTASSENTTIRLIRDSNSNGLIDNDEVLASDSNFGSPFLSSVTQDLPAGRYFASVEPRNTSISTRYDLNLVVTPFGGTLFPDPGNTLPAARDLGVLAGTFTARDYVGILDSDDFYRFTLSSAGSLQARVTGASDNTRIQLIQDNNGNGLIDNGETLENVSNFGSPFLSQFTRSLSAGTYFFRVSPRNTSDSTNYAMSLTV